MFNSEGGTKLEDVKVLENTLVTSPNNPKKDGKTFSIDMEVSSYNQILIYETNINMPNLTREISKNNQVVSYTKYSRGDGGLIGLQLNENLSAGTYVITYKDELGNVVEQVELIITC